MFKPQLMYTQTGELVLRIERDGYEVYRPTPDAIRSYSTEALTEFLNLVVPGMIDELNKRIAWNKKKERRKLKKDLEKSKKPARI